ncbi:hypothetical protein KAR10_10430, partial [bacterium]|nr:hypothetical protein [bacterium]
MVKANPDEDKWSVVKQNKIPYHDYEGNLRLYEDREEDPNEVYVKIDGVRHLIQVPRGNESMQRWMDAIKRVPTELGPVLKASRKLNKFLAQLNTSLSPEFLLTNFPRDLQTAMIHLENLDQAKLRGAIIKDIPKTIKGIYVAETGKDAGEIGQWYEEFSKYGGKISWMQGYEDVQELAKNLETDLAYAKGKHPRKAQFKKVLSYVEAMNVAVENGVRLATYRQLVTVGMSKRHAARAVANLTVDFTRHGVAGPVINSLWMFANAGIQGNVRMAKAIARSPKVQKIVGGIFSLGFMSSFLGALVGGDDEDGDSYYDKLKKSNPALFERNMVFMLPGTEGKHIRIPMPYGYNMFFVAGNEAANAIRSDEYSAIDGMGRIMSTVLNTLNPIGGATMLQTLSPTFADPLVQAEANETWFGSDLMPGQPGFGQMPKPDSERYWDSVHPWTKWAAQEVNSLTGGDPLEPGVLDVSPETIENTLANFTGSLGKLLKDTVSLPFKDDIGIRDIPFARKILGAITEHADSSIYRKNRDKVKLLDRRFRVAEPKEKQILRQNKLYRLIHRTKTTEKQL